MPARHEAMAEQQYAVQPLPCAALLLVELGVGRGELLFLDKYYCIQKGGILHLCNNSNSSASTCFNSPL